MRLAKAVQPHIANAKVGLELYSAVGPDAIAALTDLGMDVFVDLKLHDIPTTVGRAARVLGAAGRPVGQRPRRRRRRHAAGLRGRAPRPGPTTPACRRPSPSPSPSSPPSTTPSRRCSSSGPGWRPRPGAAAWSAPPPTSPSSATPSPGLQCVTPGIRPAGQRRPTTRPGWRRRPRRPTPGATSSWSAGRSPGPTTRRRRRRRGVGGRPRPAPSTS